MTVRIIKRELEARLTGKANSLFSKPSGKIERKSYGDGGERLKVKVRNLRVPDQMVVVKAAGQKIAEMPLSQGKACLDMESTEANALPALEVGQAIEIEVGGAVVLSGTLYVD